MKKIAIVTMVIMTLMLVGCNVKNDKVFSVDLSRTALEAEAEVKILQDRIRDDDFWVSTYKAADLIESTIDDGKLASVSFKLKTSEGETIILEDIYSFRLIDADDAWIKLTINQILYAMITSDEVVNAEASGKHITVESTILKWNTPGIDSKMTVSVCDIENDGKWDYVCQGRMYFTTSESATVVPADDSGYGIGNTSLIEPKIYKVKRNANFSDLTVIVSD